MNLLNKLGLIHKKRGIFDRISGNSDIKWAFEAALRAPKPVHILLVGPPGVGKTRFLKAIEARFPDSYFALSSGATGQGMVNQLFEKQPRYLLIDELEDMRKSDQSCLLSLMQDGQLVETKVSKTRSLFLNCSVFATCNNLKKLREPLLTRFTVFHMAEYSKEGFIQVASEQVNHPLVIFIAEQVWQSFEKPNIRDVEKIANMCESEEEIIKMIGLLKHEN